MRSLDVHALLPPHLHVARRLGSGGFATVWDAFDDRRPGVPLAIKLTESASQTAQLRTEAYVCQRGRDPHILRAFEMGELDRHHAYLLMERLDGFNLEQLVDRGPLDISDAVEITKQVLRALHRIHTLGVVHRDVKAANVMVTVDPRGTIVAKLIDFGLALPFWRAIRPVAEGMVAGSPAYMSAEQLRGHPLDARCDVYGAGALLYELLTAEPPHWGDSIVDVVRLALVGPLKDPTELSPHVPRSVGRIALRALARRRHERYQSCAAMLADLATLDVLPEARRPQLESGLRLASARAPTLLDARRPIVDTHTRPFALIRRQTARWELPVVVDTG